MTPTLAAAVLTMMILGTIGLCGTAPSVSDAPKLPRTVGAWTKAGPPLAVDAETIFDYMDGAGELYLAFGFDRLEVTEYKATGRPDRLTAEIYFMRSPADAFGLLSQDWGGEAVNLSAAPAPAKTIAPTARALYGGGLLRMSAGRLYARITAESETPEGREAVLALGRAVAAGREYTAEPPLLGCLPAAVESQWTPRRDRLAIFRSHLVLNSLFYLGSRNILDLGPDTEGMVVPYERKTGDSTALRFHFIVIHYPTEARARQALDHFIKDYLPQAKGPVPGAPMPGVVQVEYGWVAFGVSKDNLVLVMGSSDRETAAKAWAAVRTGDISKEAVHEER